MSASSPYAFESMSPFVGPVQGSPTEALNRSIQALVETRPWIRLMGVFAAIGAGLFGLRCLLAVPALLNRLVGMMNGEPGGFDGLQIFTGLISVCVPVLCFFSAKYLLKYASAITRAENTEACTTLLTHLFSKKKIWRLATICAVIIIVMFVVMYAIARIMNGIEWLFAEPFENNLASIVMRLRIVHSSHGNE